MKANELMIGDWVECTYWTPSKQLKVAEIRRIMDDEIKIGVYSDDLILIFRQSEVKPIPLTPEILEKNGFVENRGVTSWKFETDREDLIDIYGVKDYHLSINIEDTHGSGKGYRWMLNNLTIFYVHQLQHALRLCGIDKTIEL